MLKELEDLGLSEKEAKVYLASLEIGRATADQLAKHAKIVRPTTYVQIKTLMEKGLMSTFEEGKKTYFAPESPEALRRVLDQQKEQIRTREDELKRLLPGLSQMFDSAGERPVVRFFPGQEGIKKVREELLSTKEKNIDAIFSYEHLLRFYGEKELDEYSARRKSLGIHSRAIYLNEEHYDLAGIDALTERRFLPPSMLTLNIHIHVTDKKTVIFPLEGTLFALVIESDEVTSGMKAIFNFLWEHAMKPSDRQA